MTERTLDVAVPAYFYPVGHEKQWQILASGRHRIRYVVVNPHDGVGEAQDPAYVDVCRLLARAHVLTIGYIDTEYGERPQGDVVAEASAYRDRYGVRGVFLDQVSSGIDMLTHYENYVIALRTVGVRFVVLNPGVYAHPGYFKIANQVVAFEGSWASYRRLEVPEWSEGDRGAASRGRGRPARGHGMPEHRTHAEPVGPASGCPGATEPPDRARPDVEARIEVARMTRRSARASSWVLAAALGSTAVLVLATGPAAPAASACPPRVRSPPRTPNWRPRP
jgi:hypothetical protein